MERSDLATRLARGDLDTRIQDVYAVRPDQLPAVRDRLTDLAQSYARVFPGRPATLFTAPGRTEMGGNHTDHQLGQVLAGSVTLDMIACAGVNGTRTIEVRSAGYPDVIIDVDDLEPHPDERETSAALVRGVARGLRDRGHELGGVSAYVSSSVPGGSGLSSSAAYEVLIGVILNHLCCDGRVSPVELAKIGQYAENEFFGKPCGLMDQLACAVGGVVHIDFATPAEPVITRIDADLAGYALCIIDSGADHADLTVEYAEIIDEMSAVATHLGHQQLGHLDPAVFWAHLASVRAATGDRAVLRATHFFEDTSRVPAQAAALAEGRLDDFLALVTASGISSATHLQNLYPASTPQHQAVGVTIALAQHLLGGRGAARVHGGGFAGTVQAYVPSDLVNEFRAGIEAVLGEGACHVLGIRPVGGAVISD